MNLMVLPSQLEYCVSDAIACRNKVALFNYTLERAVGLYI